MEKTKDTIITIFGFVVMALIIFIMGAADSIGAILF